jgi:signal transduction histidine kinase
VNPKIRQAASNIVRLMQTGLGQRSRSSELAETMISSLEVLFESLSKEYNSSISQEPLMVAVRRPKSEDDDIKRLIVATSYWAMSVRGSNDVVEFFTLPATELTSLRNAELPSRCKLRLTIIEHGDSEASCMMDGLSLTAEELTTLLRSVFKDLNIKSRADFDQLPESVRLLSGAQSLTRSVRSLLGEKHALVQKIVDQQEAIQGQIARELHDAVLGNVMLLKRSLSGAKRMPDSEMIEILTEISSRLRELCQDLSPRDLKDCGLQPMLEELCSNMGKRTELKCDFDCPVAIPSLPDEVALHIYRIAQESFNNIAKHAAATCVNLSICVQKGRFTMVIKDDGKGFDADVTPERTNKGGFGTSIIRERADLIECIYPTRIWIDSTPGKGTQISLEIMYAAE